MSSSLAFDMRGSGPAVLLIHGHPFDRSMWRPQLAFFAATHRVLAPDLRGYGASPVTPGVVRFEQHVADLVALLDAERIDHAAVVGLSQGGQIALEFVRAHPGRVSAVALVDTFATLDTPVNRQKRLDNAARIERDGMHDYAEELLPGMLGPRALAEQPDVVAHVRTMMHGASPHGAAASLRGRAERIDYTPALALIAAPTLVVVGADDAFTPVSDAEYMRDRIPGARLRVIDNVGHLPNLEAPDAFNAELALFLAQCAQ
jgi:pimeloyl-ACP methyl ester carboxylesterase